MVWQIIVRYSDCPYSEANAFGKDICHNPKNKTWNPRYCEKDKCPIKYEVKP